MSREGLEITASTLWDQLDAAALALQQAHHQLGARHVEPVTLEALVHDPRHLVVAPGVQRHQQALQAGAPLAARMRPSSLDEVVARAAALKPGATVVVEKTPSHSTCAPAIAASSVIPIANLIVSPSENAP